MGIEALYRRPRTTTPEPGHKIYPYLLRDMAIPRPNQVWAMDITYIPMERGFVYRRRARLGPPPGAVMAAVDHVGGGLLRRDAGGCPGPSRQAGNLQHRPGLAVQRRGVHPRSRLQWHRHQDGRQRRMARQRNRRAAMAQRQNEEVYLRVYESVGEARNSIGRYLDFYNSRRPHSSLTTPHQIKPTSANRHSAWRPNPGRRSTYRRGDSVQTTGTSSDAAA
jgi:putative transposase